MSASAQKLGGYRSLFTMTTAEVALAVMKQIRKANIPPAFTDLASPKLPTKSLLDSPLYLRASGMIKKTYFLTKVQEPQG